MIIYKKLKEISEKRATVKFDLERRRLGKLAFAGVLGGKFLTSFDDIVVTEHTRARRKNTSAIKLAAQLSSDANDEDLTLVNQLGVEYVTIWTSGNEATYENFLRLRQKVEGAGLKIWNIGNGDVHNMEEVTLNLPGRDAKIEEYKTYLRYLSKAGIYYTTYAHMGNGI